MPNAVIAGAAFEAFADGAYAGDKLRNAMATLGQWIFEIIKRELQLTMVATGARSLAEIGRDSVTPPEAVVA